MIKNTMQKGNFHTHTTFCDGKESVESMVMAAIEKRFISLGFSGHGYTYFDSSYCMKKEEINLYVEEVKRVAEKYKSQIAVYVGVEQDVFSKESTDTFDYVIGSAHYIEQNGVFACVDVDAETTQENINTMFSGDGLAYAKAYFETISTVLEITKADMIGHFDLVTKFNEKTVLFDVKDPKYKKYACTAIDALLPYGKPFEINTCYV